MRKIRISPGALYGVSIIVMAAIVLITYSKFPPEIPLYYSLPSGSEQIAESWLLILVPIVMFVCMAINNFFQKSLLRGNEFTEKIILVTNYIVVAAGLYIFIKILLRVI